jgi:SAM-dependent methyltransferase
MNKNDNRRCNLRVVSSSGNAQNRSTYESKSRFLGAMWNESYQKWSARIRVDGKQYFGGYYNTEEEAFTESERLRAMYAPFSQAACARKMMWKYIDFDSADCGYKHESLLPNSTCPECSKKIPKLKFKEPFYFEIGAGYRPTEGYVHNDLKFDNHIEVVYDAEKVHEILETKADIVRATHILEHFPFRNTVEILENWSSILKPGGQLYIEVPNVLGHANGVVSGETSEEDFGTFMYGEQDYPGNFHMAGFTPSILRKRLEQAGLENINIQDIGMVVIGSGTKVV